MNVDKEKNSSEEYGNDKKFTFVAERRGELFPENYNLVLMRV